MWPTQQPAATERCSAYLLFSFSNKLKQTKKNQLGESLTLLKGALLHSPVLHSACYGYFSQQKITCHFLE